MFGVPRLTRSVWVGAAGLGRGGGAARRRPSRCSPLFDALCCVCCLPADLRPQESWRGPTPLFPQSPQRWAATRPVQNVPQPVLASASLPLSAPLCLEPCLLGWCCTAGFLKLINNHDLFIFWERTVRCSSFKRLEYFVLKKRRKATLSFKTQTAKLTLLLVLWYCSWFFGLYLIEAFEILWNWTQRA